jgi:crotonobetainyl-CoA:carnitine CoA-transferase CaiB-like acyl-CoA transferase
MTLNLKHPDGLDIFKQLARDADVIVENYHPDAKHRLGIDYEAIKAINPRIVYGSIAGFGQDGPYADRPGVDPIVQGMGGHMMVTRAHTSAAWINILNHAGVPCGPIYTLEETFNAPQVQHFGIAQTVESPKLGPTTLIGQAFHLSRPLSRLVSAAPECGADTDAILQELGYGAEAIATLRAHQVI